MMQRAARSSQRTARFALCAFVTTLSLAAIHVLSSGTLLTNPRSALAQARAFRFIAWSDTHNDPDMARNNAQISTLSDHIVALNPAFTIVAGDLEENGFNADGMDVWKAAVDGEYSGDPTPNGLFGKTFTSRGNHDVQTGVSGWETFFDLQSTANRIGATNYGDLAGEENRTYSFDYGNAHLVSLDVPGRFDLAVTSARLAWLDSDLAAAENRSLTHAFLFFHGPLYCIQAGTLNMCPYAPPGSRSNPMPEMNNDMVDIINRHPIVAALFGGHEGTSPFTHVDSSRIPALTRPFEQILVGNASYDNYCSDDYQARYDYCPSGTGFLAVDVSGSSFTASWYATGQTTPIHSIALPEPTLPTPSPSPTATCTATPTATVTPTSTSSPTPTTTRTPPLTPTSVPSPIRFKPGADNPLYLPDVSR